MLFAAFAVRICPEGAFSLDSILKAKTLTHLHEFKSDLGLCVETTCFVFLPPDVFSLPAD